jgi:hypothetical protein
LKPTNVMVSDDGLAARGKSQSHKEPAAGAWLSAQVQ